MLRKCVCCSVLLAFLGLGSPSLQAQDNDDLPLSNRIMGGILDLCVKAGMTEDQVMALFGWPDVTGADSCGTITHTYTCVSYRYRRYGVVVFFHYLPGSDQPKPRYAYKVEGGLQ